MTIYKTDYESVVKNLQIEYSKFLADEITYVNGQEAPIFSGLYIVTNFCPRCGSFGIHKPNDVIFCSKCNFKIWIPE